MNQCQKTCWEEQKKFQPFSGQKIGFKMCIFGLNWNDFDYKFSKVVNLILRTVLAEKIEISTKKIFEKKIWQNFQKYDQNA